MNIKVTYQEYVNNHVTLTEYFCDTKKVLNNILWNLYQYHLNFS